MNQYQPVSAEHGAPDGRAIHFTGTWRDYLPIAASNVLLTIVTLGVYRFWAAARQRRYLWSHTMVIDDQLEWTGTGREMFIGFLIVMAILLPFFIFIQFRFPAMIARGKDGAAMGVIGLFEIGLVYLGGFARFRALRYRLSRTWWHGIRGGSDEPGWTYGGEYLGRMALAGMTMFVLYPWAATRLWNGRWNEMSFGGMRFRANLTASELKARWAAVYLVPIVAIVIGVIFAAAAGLILAGPRGSGTNAVSIGLIVGALFALFYLAIPLMVMAFYAKYYREAADSLRLGDLEFGFDATTMQWIGLFLGNLGLAVVTLGAGISYWGYRNWAFMVRHMHLYGEVNVSELTQSTTRAPTEAEGFADAFDIGAI